MGKRIKKPLSIKDNVLNFKTKNVQGFIESEVTTLLKEYPDINMDKFNDALMGVTGFITTDGDFLIYRDDIVLAITCGVENRNMKSYEWD